MGQSVSSKRSRKRPTLGVLKSQLVPSAGAAGAVRDLGGVRDGAPDWFLYCSSAAPSFVVDQGNS